MGSGIALLTQLFRMLGDPRHNIGYAMLLQDELQCEGHHEVLDFKSRKEIICNMEKIVITDKMNLCKESKLEPLLANEH